MSQKCSPTVLNRASCGIAYVRSPATPTWQGSLYAHVGRIEGGPVIAANTSTWIASRVTQHPPASQNSV